MFGIKILTDIKPALINSFTVLALVGFASAAQAATDTDTFAVTISIDGTCTIAATDIAFGNTAEGSTNVDANGTITVNCTTYTPYQIGLDNGFHEDSGNRRMSDGGSGYIVYQLYSDATHTTMWGNTIGVNTVDSTGTGADETYTVYGRVPSTASATAGGYSDTVTATITF